MENERSLPDTLSSLQSSQRLADIYGGFGRIDLPGEEFQHKLARLELQALFWLLVDVLETAPVGMKSLRLQSEGGILGIELRGEGAAGPCSSLDPDASESAGRALGFMRTLPYLTQTHGFFVFLRDHPITRGNCWETARQVLGEEAACAMQCAHLQRHTDASPGSGNLLSKMRI